MPNDPAQKIDPSTPVDVPTSLPDLSHDMPPAPVGDITPPPPTAVEEIPDPTSPPPPGADLPQEQSFIPPIITPPAPSRSKAKIVGALLGLLILVVSIPAGIFLVQRNQEIREKADCDPNECLRYEQVNGACNGYEQVNGACNGHAEGPCDDNDPETGECTHNAEGPCNSWEQVDGDCNSWEQVDGPNCEEYRQCEEPLVCDDYSEACDNGGVKICHKEEQDGECVPTNGDGACGECSGPSCGDGVCAEGESCEEDCGAPRESCTYNEFCIVDDGTGNEGIKECNGSKLPGDDNPCEYDESINPSCSECFTRSASFTGSCSVGDTGNGSFSYSCQVYCSTITSPNLCIETFNLSSSWFHCKTQGGAACGEGSGDKDGSGTPSLSNPTITTQVGSSSVSGTGNYSAYSCGRTQFDVAINDLTNVAGGVRDMRSDCSPTCASQGFWCANNNAQCGAPHVRRSEFSCDQPSQVCCQLVDTGTTPTAQCTNVKVYDANNNQLSATQLTQLRAGDSIKLAINGSASSGTIDKARFRINAGAWQETTVKNSSNEYFINYTIQAGTTSFQIEGMIHHQSLNDWF